MSGRARWGPLLFFLSLAACKATDEGVLVEVTQKAGSAPVELDHLTINVGIERDDIGTINYVMDPDSTLGPLDVAGRDLTADPYRVLVRDGIPEDATRITVAVRAFRGDAQVAFAAVSPISFVPDKVLLIKVELDPAWATSVTTSGCVRWSRNGEIVFLAPTSDQDCDGDATQGAGRMDCNDTNAGVGPSRAEICANGVDDNCNDATDEEVDGDSDQVTNCGGDCDDSDDTVGPNQPEVCDNKDNDCDELCDDGFDVDEDHVTSCGSTLLDGKCGEIQIAEDCNDGDPLIHPGLADTCDGKDNDCNGTCDDGFDGDGDRFSDCGTHPGPPIEGVCGSSAALADCQPTLSAIHPFQHELCNGKDDDCDMQRLATSPCFITVDTSCQIGARACDDNDSDGSSGYGTCTAVGEPTLVPAALCTAYAGAGCNTDADPFRCAVGAAASARYTCTVRYAPSGSLCPTRSVALHEFGGDTCTWGILGGQAQENYSVGLALTSGGTPSATLAVCDGFFSLISSHSKIPTADTVHLVYGDNLTTTLRNLVEYRLNPVSVASCTQAGLECTIVQ